MTSALLLAAIGLALGFGWIVLAVRRRRRQRSVGVCVYRPVWQNQQRELAQHPAHIPAFKSLTKKRTKRR